MQKAWSSTETNSKTALPIELRAGKGKQFNA